MATFFCAWNIETRLLLLRWRQYVSLLCVYCLKFVVIIIIIIITIIIITIIISSSGIIIITIITITIIIVIIIENWPQLLYLKVFRFNELLLQTKWSETYKTISFVFPKLTNFWNLIYF